MTESETEKPRDKNKDKFEKHDKESAIIHLNVNSFKQPTIQKQRYKTSKNFHFLWIPVFIQYSLIYIS
jgi:hypothetical protein